MLLAKTTSKNNVTIRLTSERWHHITTSHLEIDPEDYKSIWIVVPYKELNREDGFVLTAYITTDSSWLFQKEIIWSKE